MKIRRPRPSAFACTRCGALVIAGLQKTHDDWHDHLELIRQFLLDSTSPARHERICHGEAGT